MPPEPDVPIGDEDTGVPSETVRLDAVVALLTALLVILEIVGIAAVIAAAVWVFPDYLPVALSIAVGLVLGGVPIYQLIRYTIHSRRTLAFADVTRQPGDARPLATCLQGHVWLKAHNRMGNQWWRGALLFDICFALSITIVVRNHYGYLAGLVAVLGYALTVLALTALMLAAVPESVMVAAYGSDEAEAPT